MGPGASFCFSTAHPLFLVPCLSPREKIYSFIASRDKPSFSTVLALLDGPSRLGRTLRRVPPLRSRDDGRPLSTPSGHDCDVASRLPLRKSAARRLFFHASYPSCHVLTWSIPADPLSPGVTSALCMPMSRPHFLLCSCPMYTASNNTLETCTPSARFVHTILRYGVGDSSFVLQ